MAYRTTFFKQKYREMCHTCILNMTCDHYLKQKGILACENYNPQVGTTTCRTCGKLYVTGRDIRCQYCGTLLLNPRGWRPLYARVNSEGRIIKTFKSRPSKLRKVEEEFSKIVIRKHAKI